MCIRANIKRSFRIFVLAVIGIVFSIGCEKLAKYQEVLIHKASGETVVVKVEVAKKPEERRLGLMYRKSLGKDRGMLFIFPNEKKHTFIMENTYTPLDIIFIGRDGCIVGWSENARPLSKEKYSIEKPSKYALEVNAFFCRDNGIKAGDKVSFKNIPEKILR